jgi:hypothetical protein
MKKLYSVEIKGDRHNWSFNTYLEGNYIEDYRADGLEINEIVNIAPSWIVDLGLLRVWFLLQDVWNFKWLYFIINRR